MTQTRDGRDIEIVDNPDQSRFEAWVGGALVGRAVYRATTGSITFTHTEVDQELQGQGVAQELARQALDSVRAAGGSVVAQCPFIASYIQRHPEYAGLV